MFEDLTSNQIAILNYIKNQKASKGYPPSVREICSAVGLKSTSSVHNNLEKLERKGYIRRDATKPRAIEILSKGIDEESDYMLLKKETIDIPIVGRITAGAPILAQENIEDVFTLPAEFVPKGSSFMLRVKGDSMINKGIYNDDYVLITKRDTARDGDVVVALLNEEATLKTFYKEKEFVRLQPENDSMSPIYVKDVKILGKAVGVFRIMK